MIIEFGLKLPDHLDIVTFARQAESMNVDYVFQGEHVFFHGPVSNSLIDLSFAAAATQRLKLPSSVTLIPLYPIVGTSSDCAEQIHGFMEPGAEAVCFNLLADPDDYDRRMQQLCADVPPAAGRLGTVIERGVGSGD